MLRSSTVLMFFALSANMSLWFLNVMFLMKRGDNCKREMTTLSLHQNLLLKQSKVKTLYPDIRNIRYILNNVTICDTSKPLSLLYVVSSSITHFENRKNIRATFANSSYFKKYTVRVVFFLGKPKRPGYTQIKIEDEHRKYGDVIQGDFLDAYRNLTIKVLTEFHWIANYCPKVVAVGKIDDDTFVDTVKLLTTYLPPLRTRKNYILCNYHYRMRIERRGRWGMPADKLKSYSTYPWKYCSGYAVIIPRDIIVKLLKASLVSPFLWVDDVYFSGILPSRLLGVRYKNVPNKNTKKAWHNNISCFLDKTCEDLFGIVRHFDMPRIWNFTINNRYHGQEF